MVITTEKFIGRLAAVVGAVQGFVWTLLSLICLIIYYKDHSIEIPKDITFNFILKSRLEMIYLSNTYNKAFLSKPEIMADKFNVIMWFYFFLNLWLLGQSLELFVKIQSNKSGQSKSMLAWGMGTALVSAADLLVSVIFMRDFLNCLPRNIVTNSDVVESLLCHSITGIAMTLAARGYALWALNVFLCVVTIINGKRMLALDKMKGAVVGNNIPMNVPQQMPTSVYPNYLSAAHGTAMRPIDQTPMFTNQHRRTVDQIPMSRNHPGEYAAFSRDQNRYAF